VLVFSLNDASPSPDRFRRHCSVQARERRALALLNADSRIIHALVLKVDALQPHSFFMAGRRLIGAGP
jgi:hypothetical protein